MSSKSDTSAGSSSSNLYPEEIRRQAVDLFNSSLPEYKTRQATAKRAAALLGVRCFDTVLSWVRRSEIHSGAIVGITAESAEELRRL
ncbi:hypothetical protein FACS1894216_19230 [Synergistales bacterium]|nr:hypothetical protein FACS1894216_19230 [Synergistales bacterium]